MSNLLQYMYMLNITNLTKKYGSKVAVSSLSLEIKAGELFCLIGPNGSGKTTLIKTVLGLLNPSEGSILINGIDIQKKPESAKALMGYVPDEPTGWGNVTGEEFLHIVGSLYGVPEKLRKQKIPGLLAEFHVEEEAQMYFEQYSRGNKQKFAILAALIHEPKLLLIDEPIIGLDPISAKKAEDLFTRFVASGGAMLMVTHTLSVAQHLASRIGFLKRGELKAVGTLSELEAKLALSSASTLDEVYEKLVTI